MKKKHKLLFVDDDKTFSMVMKRELSRRGYIVICADCGEAAIKELKRYDFDVIILDIKMPGMGGLKALREIKEITPETEIIMLTGRATVENAVESMKIGAYDYVTKPCRLNELDILLKKAYEKKLLSKENNSLKRLVNCKEPDQVILSRDEKMKRVFDLIGKVAKTDSTVLIQGESGTGKELVARAIHDESRRKNHSFIALNCATLNESLLESELFGHVKGAFTGAHDNRIGLFEATEGGSLFLDEIGELPVSIQAKLLRVLESGEIRRLGDSRTLFVDTRIITATNKDLVSEVRKGAFREDLFFRINVVQISLPPLRERKKDIPLLVSHFLKKHKIHANEKIVCPDVFKWLIKYDWPGNVRELENLIENLIVVVEKEKIDVCDLPEKICGQIIRNSHRFDETLSLSDLEKQYITTSLSRMDGDKKRVAEILGISLKTLYNKIKLYGLHHKPD
ncbi:MAG: sigma-54 dependent transcriptional regulator [Candidatus Scalindua sp.]|nr:sigma-54 dependent transcriptional regulator [Candidatus Scalindua sp.]